MGGDCSRGTGERTLRQVQAMLCLAATSAVLIWIIQMRAVGMPLQTLAVGLAVILILLSLIVISRALRPYVLSEQRRETAIAQDARLLGTSLLVNTLRHRLANKLAVTVGYSELLAEDPRLAEDLREHAHKIMTSAMAAADTVNSLAAHAVAAPVDTSLYGPPLLDLRASIAGTLQPSD